MGFENPTNFGGVNLSREGAYDTMKSFNKQLRENNISDEKQLKEVGLNKPSTEPEVKKTGFGTF